MIRIHGIAKSRAFRCIWAAEEAGLPYEVVPVGFGPGMKAAAHLKVNPNGNCIGASVRWRPRSRA